MQKLLQQSAKVGGGLQPNDPKPCRNSVGSKRCLGHVPTKLNIKGRLKNNFQTAFLFSFKAD
ncbi:hypothetical protein [Neisseria sp.]